MVHSFALLLQSRLEFEKYKTMDKAAIQIQVLVDQYDRYPLFLLPMRPPHFSDLEKDYNVAIRMKFLHLLYYPPLHEVISCWICTNLLTAAQT